MNTNANKPGKLGDVAKASGATEPKNGPVSTATGSAAQAKADNDEPVFDGKAAGEIGAKLFRADSTFERAIDEVANETALLLGTEPTFSLWNNVQAAWVKGYMEASGKHPAGHAAAGQSKANEATATKRWLEVAKKMEGFNLSKPKAPNPAATEKSEQRAKVKAENATFLEAQKIALPAIPDKPADIDPKAMREAAKLVRKTLQGKVSQNLSKMQRTELTERAASFDKAADRALESAERTERAEITERVTAALKRLPLSMARKIDALTAELVEENEPQPAEDQPDATETAGDKVGDGADGAQRAA